MGSRPPFLRPPRAVPRGSAGAALPGPGAVHVAQPEPGLQLRAEQLVTLPGAARALARHPARGPGLPGAGLPGALRSLCANVDAQGGPGGSSSVCAGDGDEARGPEGPCQPLASLARLRGFSVSRATWAAWFHRVSGKIGLLPGPRSPKGSPVPFQLRRRPSALSAAGTPELVPSRVLAGAALRGCSARHGPHSGSVLTGSWPSRHLIGLSRPRCPWQVWCVLCLFPPTTTSCDLSNLVCFSPVCSTGARLLEKEECLRSRALLCPRPRTPGADCMAQEVFGSEPAIREYSRVSSSGAGVGGGGGWTGGPLTSLCSGKT